MVAREELQPPSPTEISAISEIVHIIHPGCNETLLSFPAFGEPLTPTETVYGVDRRLIIDACRILTNFASKANVQVDYLALDQEGKQPISTTSDLVEPGSYYYFLGPTDTATNYGIVDDFRALSFPDSVPPHWSRAKDRLEVVELRRRFAKFSSTIISDLVKFDDGCCLITKYYNGASFDHIGIAYTQHVNCGCSLRDRSSRA